MRPFKLSSILLGSLCLIALLGCSNTTTGEQVEVIQNGQSFSLDKMTFDPKEEGNNTSIKPDNPSEYYNYYQEYEGYEYYYVKGTLKNTDEQAKDISAYYVESETSGKRDEAKIAVTDEAKSDFIKYIDPGSKVDCYLITLVKEGVEAPDSFHIFSGSNDDNKWKSEIQYNTNFK